MGISIKVLVSAEHKRLLESRRILGLGTMSHQVQEALEQYFLSLDDEFAAAVKREGGP